MRRIESIFIVVGIALAAGAAWWCYAGVYLPTTWPQARSSIVSSRIINPGGPNKYTPEITFHYVVRGVPYDTVVVPSWSSGSYDLVRGHVDRFPAGSSGFVAVNPDDPRDIRYEIGASLSTLIGPGVLGLLAVIFGGIGVGTLYWSKRPARRAVGPESDWRHAVPADDGRLMRRVGGAFGTIGLIVLAVGIWMAWSDAAMLRDWPSVDAEVVASSVVSSTRTGSSSRSLSSPTMYDTQVTFRYEVAGRRFENATTYGISSSNPSDARDRVREFAPGTRHTIRHRPGDPNIIRFDMDSTIAVFALSGGLSLMGLVFVGLGAAVYKVFGSSRR
jgi:hypothetical protein